MDIFGTTLTNASYRMLSVSQIKRPLACGYNEDEWSTMLDYVLLHN